MLAVVANLATIAILVLLAVFLYQRVRAGGPLSG